MKQTKKTKKQDTDLIENNKSITAVEWLIEQLNLVEWIEDDGAPDIQLKILRQAIEMEIRQTQDACLEVYNKCKNDFESKMLTYDEIEMQAAERFFDISSPMMASFIWGATWYNEQLKK